jgi:hypothetical protein
MGLLKAVIGGLIGSVIGTAIWLGAENMTARSMPWLALLGGLCAGLGVRFCCGQDDRSSLTGTIAAVMALLGVVIGPVANQKLMEYRFERQDKPVIRIEMEDEDEAIIDDEDEEVAETIESDLIGSEGDDSEGDDVDRDTDEADEDRASATSTTSDGPSIRSIIAAARPYLAQAAAESDDESAADAEGIPAKSPIKEFFDKNLELILYAGSAILAYILGSGGKPKEPQLPKTEEPAPA